MNRLRSILERWFGRGSSETGTRTRNGDRNQRGRHPLAELMESRALQSQLAGVALATPSPNVSVAPAAIVSTASSANATTCSASDDGTTSEPTDGSDPETVEINGQVEVDPDVIPPQP